MGEKQKTDGKNTNYQRTYGERDSRRGDTGMLRNGETAEESERRGVGRTRKQEAETKNKDENGSPAFAEDEKYGQVSGFSTEWGPAFPRMVDPPLPDSQDDKEEK